MKTHLLKGIALATLVTVTSAPLYAQTASQTAPSTPSTQAAQEPLYEEIGYGVGAALASIFYIPAKVTYAGLGLLTGGLGYVFSGGRSDAANSIIYPAVKGHYVVTPSQLKGTEPVYFVGPGPDAQQPETYAAGPTSTPNR
jgi:hypothetical protein